MINGNWSGYRELILENKIQECPGIISFYFKSADGGKLSKHIPGQFLPFRIKTDDEKYKNEMRTYSLSNYPNENIYRISVKRVEGGLISNYLHDKLSIGDSIEAMMPMGSLTIRDSSKNSPIVLISGGIGVTPLISMLYAESNTNSNIHFIQALQNSEVHPFKDDIDFIAKNKNIKNTVFYSKPLESDEEGKDYDAKGRISKEWIKDNVNLESDFYICGPPPFMKGIEEYLLELGVNKERINYE